MTVTKTDPINLQNGNLQNGNLQNGNLQNGNLQNNRDRAEDAVNLQIGRRLRRRRRIMGLTQAALGSSVGLYFQQIQKYECAANRVSAARLHTLATMLQAPVGYFYDGFADAAATVVEGQASRETDELLGAYYALTPCARKRLLTFIKALSEESGLTTR